MADGIGHTSTLRDSITGITTVKELLEKLQISCIAKQFLFIKIEYIPILIWSTNKKILFEIKA
jgi:hypothetical protein